jgi:hypothetical protein
MIGEKEVSFRGRYIQSIMDITELYKIIDETDRVLGTKSDI